MVLAIAIILMAFALPMMNVTDRMRLNDAVKQVRQEISTAKLKAVSVNRTLEIRLNCPATGQYRITEAGFSSTGRCDGASYPYPAPQDAPYQTPPKPRYDGPIRQLDGRITLNASEPQLVLQFLPNGQVLKLSGTTSSLISSQDITLAIGSLTKTVNVNAFGKIVAQQ